MPEFYKERLTAVAGRGLFTSKDLKASALLFQDKSPFVAVLDSPVLTTACSWCFIFAEEASTSRTVSVSACTGCKIVRYCGKACQTASWKHSHKYECKVYKALYPQVLPNTARMILQILLRRKNGAIDQEEWDNFLKLQHHMDELEKNANQGNEYHQQTLQNVKLMARAGKEYSGSVENPQFVESLVGRLITNTLTLTSSVLTPLGLLLSLKGSIVNHSCAPNSVITYNGRTLSFRILEPVTADTELTIAYITTTMATSSRQAELRNRYHFLCKCSQCSHDLTLGHKDTSLSIESLSTVEERANFETRIATLLTNAKSSVPSESLLLLSQAYVLVSSSPDYPAYLSPVYQLRFDLITSFQANKFYVAAFIQSLIIHFDVLPVVYPQPAHPARVARTWVHAKMAGHIGGLANEPDFAKEVGAVEEGKLAKAIGTKFGLDWGLVVYCLVKDVSDQVLKSHGVDSGFSTEVGREMSELKLEARQTRGEPSLGELDGAKQGLKLIATEGWKWWKDWMREQRSKQIVDARSSVDAVDPIGIFLQ